MTASNLGRALCALALFVTSGCATNSMKEKILRNALIAGAVGYALGQQKSENQAAYSSMYAGNFAAIGALWSVYYYDPDKEIEESRKRSRDLAKSMDEFANGNTSYSTGRAISSGPAMHNVQALPEKYRRLISQGEWTLKQIDEWEQIDEFRKVHKTEMLELTPATFNK